MLDQLLFTLTSQRFRDTPARKTITVNGQEVEVAGF
uniref:Uncharacterized protein n=1 Tax=Parascaris equorum TaxID=6256 RepID=A0A914RL66_PAREQ